METVFEGTWDEIATHREELGDRRLRVTVLDPPDEAAIRERRERLERALETLREIGKDKGPYPNYVMDNEFFYPDDEERA